MKDYIKIGVEQGLISFDEEMSRITYTFQNKSRNYNNPRAKQQQIVDCIADIRTKAKALQAEGKAILEDAKRKVVQMIIEK